MIDNYITRAVVAAITSKKKPDWDHFDDLMIWALDTCQDQAAVFIMAAKLADPTLTIKSFDLYDWDKFVTVGSGDARGGVFWDRGNKMPAWMFFLIAAEGVCVSPVKTWDATVEFRLDREEQDFPLFDGIDISTSFPADFIREDAIWGSITGESGYSVITKPDEQYGDVPSLEHLFNEVPFIKVINDCKEIFVDSAEGTSRNGGELYVAQIFDSNDVCANLYRRGDRKDPFCEGRTFIYYYFIGMDYWPQSLTARKYIRYEDATLLRNEARRLRNEARRFDFYVPSRTTGEIRMELKGLTALEELALFLLDKGYTISILNKLRVTTESGRYFPPTLYLHFLTRAELAGLDEEVLEELEVFL